MGIEIKQLTVKSTISSGRVESDGDIRAREEFDAELLKEQILDSCREQIEQMLNDSRDR